MPPQASNLELLVSALDKYVGSLVEQINEHSTAEETAIFILPDHKIIGQGASVLSKFKEDRKLFFLSSHPIDFVDPKQGMTQMDVGKSILNGAEVTHNMYFLSDFLKEDPHSFISKNIGQILQLNESALAIDTTAVLKNTQDQNPDTTKVQLISRSWRDEQLINSEIRIGSSKLIASRGINLLYIEENQFRHQVFDTFENEAEVIQLRNQLKGLISRGDYFLILVHDSAGDLLKNSQVEFDELGLPQLGKLGNRTAYLAQSQFGLSSEATHRNSLEISIPMNEHLSLRNAEEVGSQVGDPSRFIAHAGGIIDGKTYTNSLEALNNSYKKGFRYFELDIIQTADGHFVGAHDWKHWKKQTGYSGATPPNLDTFKQQKLNQKYTPLTLVDINRWFEIHPDAVLVTDKVDSPKNFIAQFDYPDRLFMELFTQGAIAEANALNFEGVIISENLLNDLPGNKIENLKSMKVERVAISYRTALKRKALCEQMTQAGIEIYVFHVNTDLLHDEAYVVRECLDFVHGMYADDWSFPN